MRVHGCHWLYLTVAVLLAGLAAGCSSEADRVTGAWQGTIDLSSAAPLRVRPGTTLRVVCNIRKNSDGTLAGTLDSPDQHASGIPIDSVTVKDGAFHLQANKIAASYDGQVSKEGSQISGEWKQGQFSLPMTMTKSK